MRREWKLTVDGYKVPHVTVELRGDDESGPNWTLVVDGRYATEYVSFEEIQRWSAVLANMGAVCAGFTCHGENSQPENRFKRQLGRLSSDNMARFNRESMHAVDDRDVE